MACSTGALRGCRRRPLILGGALGADARAGGDPLNANLLTSGVATLIQTLGFWKFGARLPLVQACSFIALAPMIMIGKHGLAHVFGAVIAGGAITVLLAPMNRPAAASSRPWSSAT
jgi:NCS2 family nucleobase:cation symporter-2